MKIQSLQAVFREGLALRRAAHLGIAAVAALLAGCNSSSSSSSFVYTPAPCPANGLGLNFDISGAVGIAPGQAIDIDPIAPLFIDGNPNPRPPENGSLATAQTVTPPAVIGGATVMMMPNYDSLWDDTSDFYFIPGLVAGDTVRLYVINASYANDLDLYLTDSNLNPVKESVASARKQVLEIDIDGDYYVEVRNQMGRSLYILAVGDTPGVVSDPLANFVAGGLRVDLYYDDIDSRGYFVPTGDTADVDPITGAYTFTNITSGCYFVFASTAINGDDYRYGREAWGGYISRTDRELVILDADATDIDFDVTYYYNY